MRDLDDLKTIETYDSGQSLASLIALPDQCQQAWDDVSKLSFPREYRSPSSLLFCGMGGSNYAARIIKSLFSDTLKIPVDIVADYHLPAYVDNDVLIIAASYSGTTHETLSLVSEALKIDAKIIGVTVGGELSEVLERNLRPVYKILPIHNPSMQPRLAQGYMQLGQIAILNFLGLLKIEEKEIEKLIEFLESQIKNLIPSIPLKDNKAKELAVKFESKIVNLIAGEFLEGAVHSVRNPLHETGKHFANDFILPELNHHLIEGLGYPESLAENLVFWLINSPLYSRKIRKRLELTGTVIEKNKIEVVETNLSPTTKLIEVFELINLGSFVAFYLAVLAGIDPARIPWVNYFKENLKKGEEL